MVRSPKRDFDRGPRMADDPRHSRSACPRCGYDLRGAIDTWQEACPIEGICTECGLGFAWREILSSRFIMPEWCIEAKRGALAVPRQVAGTAARTWWPWAFWSGLHMTHLTRWRRLALYYGLLLVILYLMFVAFVGLPLLTSELVVGRMAQLSPVKALEKLAGPRWKPWTPPCATFSARCFPRP